MKRTTVILLSVMLQGIFTFANATEGVENVGTVNHDNFYSKAIDKALLKEDAKRFYYVYLPPSYHQGDKAYSVIYYLHGFNEPYSYIISQKKALDEAMSMAGGKEFIIVQPDASSTLGGPFYANSEASGNWEDFIVEELVAAVDKKYRTIANKKGRGLAGFSMGGTGAINIAFKHSDKYDAVYAHAAGLLKAGDLPVMLKTWSGNRAYLDSYGAAASANKKQPSPFAEIAFETYPAGVENDRVVNNWYQLFGAQSEKVDAYVKRNMPLSGIKITSHTDDIFLGYAMAQKIYMQF